MTENENQPPKLILVDGDPVLGMNYILNLKSKWLKDSNGTMQWYEMEPPGKRNPSEFLNSLDSEVSTTDISGAHKVIFLRGLANSKQFKDGMMIIVSSVATGNTLLIFDEEGVIRADDKSKNNSTGWSNFRNKFATNGQIANVPPPFMSIGDIPWGARFGSEHVKAVVTAMSKRGKKISNQTVRDVFLERVMPDWSFILLELDKLADLVPGDTVTPEDVNNIVFPWEQKHAIFEFANVFNKGNYQAIMDSYDELVSCKTHPEMIFSFCMKLVRWQLIATHLISYGQNIPSSLESIGSLMNHEKAAQNTASLRNMKPHLFKDLDPKAENDEEQKGDGITSFVAKGVSSYVKDVFTQRIPIRNGALGTLTIMNVAMSNYLTMLSCIEDNRLSGDKEQARPIFRNAMQKICGRRR
jgi:hypothetical protein